MERVYSQTEAREWFIRHKNDDLKVICVEFMVPNYDLFDPWQQFSVDGVNEKTCDSYEAAKDFYNRREFHRKTVIQKMLRDRNKSKHGLRPR